MIIILKCINKYILAEEGPDSTNSEEVLKALKGSVLPRILLFGLYVEACFSTLKV